MFRNMISFHIGRVCFKLRNSKMSLSVLIPAKKESELLLFHFLSKFDVPALYFGH